ncbi:hypothetical protein C5B42_00180, partial [Candidatus Cerribacteria bacterium 'Amazon FNV 2010 28 9']
APVVTPISTPTTTPPSTCAPITGVCRNPQNPTNIQCIVTTPTPSPTVTPTPTPTAAPGCGTACSTDADCLSTMSCINNVCRNPQNPTSSTCENQPQGGFFIRKYHDHNGNGTQDSGDEGLTWKFQWQSNNDGNWHDYQTDGNHLGEGGVVTLPDGTIVEIKEVGQTGWNPTTPSDVTLTIKANQTQLMVFGNWQGASSTPVPACGSSCSSDANCPSGMTCSGGACRNPSCTSSTSCVCATTVVYVPPSPGLPPTLPKTGGVADTLKLLGAGVGAVIVGLAGLLLL